MSDCQSSIEHNLNQDMIETLFMCAITRKWRNFTDEEEEGEEREEGKNGLEEEGEEGNVLVLSLLGQNNKFGSSDEEEKRNAPKSQESDQCMTSRVP